MRTFREAAAKYLAEKEKRSLQEDVRTLRLMNEYIGDTPLNHITMDTLRPYIAERREKGLKSRTINKGLQVVRHILNIAHTEWFEEGKPWMTYQVKIRLLPQHDQRQKYPLTFDEQRRLFNHLPDHLRQMSLFMVNTGTRDSEVCNLQWSMEIPIEPLNNSVFLIPSQLVKNGYDRVIVLNSVAKQVIDGQRGKHPSHVFSFRGKPLNRMNNTGWKVARAEAGLRVRVHDLKHTYGTRLRSAGVDEETRKELLGHRSGRSITTHYCDANIKNLIEASERATNPAHESTLLTVLIRRSTR